MRNLLVAILVLATAGTFAHQAPPVAFDRTGWQSDYDALKRELERRYSHLAWFGSPQGGVDLPSLDRATRGALREARSPADGDSAIRRFVAGLRDAHMSITAVETSVPAAEPPVVSEAPTAATACAAFGFVPVTRVAFSTPFETLPGFELISDGLGESFRSGVIEQAGLRIGIVRIPRFRPQEFPLVCERAWQATQSGGGVPTRAGVVARASEEWLRLLADRVSRLKVAGARALVVDIGDNGGGNDLGDWAVRLFTRKPVASAPLLMSADTAAVPYFDEQRQELGLALASDGSAHDATRQALQTAIAGFERRKREAATTTCDMSWVWTEQRDWLSSHCRRLVDAGFASGALAYAEPGQFPHPAADALYWAARADAFRGAWDGPTYVVTNTGTGSAAEMFAALIHDRGVAKTIGSRTRGLGCGFMDAGAPFVLTHAGLAVSIPNCVRLRADGTDEVAGIAPDIPMAPGPGEHARGLAARMLTAITGDVRGVR